MIEVYELSKKYGDKLAVDNLTFTVQPGIVTGFLGPNGAGKSTTMRIIAGLDRPTAGRVLVNGREYRSSRAPMAELGVLLEARAVHTGRSARSHLLALAQTNGIGRRRVDDVIDMSRPRPTTTMLRDGTYGVVHPPAPWTGTPRSAGGRAAVRRSAGRAPRAGPRTSMSVASVVIVMPPGRGP